MIRKVKVILLVYLVMALNMVSEAKTIPPSAEEMLQVIEVVERKYDIPAGLLSSIAKIESALNPLAMNIDGRAVTSGSQKQVVELANKTLAAGLTNIDLGVMQLNYRWHGKNFTSVEQMLEPESNINYAAKLLSSLKTEHGNWQTATRYYHSKSLKHHKSYSRKVIIAWLKSDG